MNRDFKKTFFRAIAFARVIRLPAGQEQRIHFAAWRVARAAGRRAAGNPGGIVVAAAVAAEVAGSAAAAAERKS